MTNNAAPNKTALAAAAAVGDFIRRSVVEGAFPGAAWMIGNRETPLEQGAAGALGTGLGPVKPDSIYDLASMSKLFTALALMRQYEEGLLCLDDTVGYFLPGFRGTPLAEIPLSALLTHTSPLPALSNFFHYCKTREELLTALRYSNLRSDSPGRVVYTCEGFILLGEIVAAIEGEGLDKAVGRRVLEPLGMNETWYNPPAALWDRIAPTEDIPWRGGVIRGLVHDEDAFVMGGVSGNAGLFSTAADLSLLARAMLDSLGPPGKAPGETFLRRGVAELMIRNHTEGRGQNRGLGWMLAGPEAPTGELMSRRSFGHLGYTGTSLWIDPDSGIYGILLSNRVHPTRENTRHIRVRRIFHNLMMLHHGGPGPYH